MFFSFKKTEMPDEKDAPQGRPDSIPTATDHFVNGRALKGPYPETMKMAQFGMGCFWGAEKRFWSLDGIHITAVGYAGGFTPNPTYQEVCTGKTGHNEVVLVVYDPAVITYDALLKTFWESHDPTQHMRQGNDVGTQYRSGIYTYSQEQIDAAQTSKDTYQNLLQANGRGTIVTEILQAPPFYFAEDYHQQYLAKNPQGYCGLGGTGVHLPD